MPMDDDIIVRIVDMPPGAIAVTTMDSDGMANVYISKHLDIYGQQRALMHELQHIERNDFYNDLPIMAAEW
jgi:hypothetical protein